MYQVYCDSYLIYDTRVENLKLVNPKLDLELNKTGSFTFTIYPSHPHYAHLQKLKSIIQVYSNDYLIFRGRILNDDQGFYNEKVVSCEGELAFLLDSVQRPFDFQGSPKDLFEQLITAHNNQVEESKRFIVGNITVTDPNDYINRADSLYKNTWTDVNEKLIDTLGGYVWVRHEPDGNYIDYLSDFDVLSSQKIAFGKNLIDISKITKGENIATAIIPLGAKDEETEERVTIASVNDGLDYVYDQEAVDKYGWIFKTVEWNDVTLPENLLTKAKAYLAESINLSVSIELDAFDLASADADINTFRLGTYIKVSTAPHSLDAYFLVRKLSINLDSPSKNKLTLGVNYSTFSEQVQSVEKTQTEVITQVNAATREISGFTNNVTSQISQSASEILSIVSNDYYLKADTDELINSVSTKLSQTEDEFEFQFNRFVADLNAIASNNDVQFESIRKYIRFVDGNIVLGEEGNEITLKIQNNRISFLQNNVEVAYFANRKIYVTDGEFINSLAVGNFAFMPRTNGNLSFKKVK